MDKQKYKDYGLAFVVALTAGFILKEIMDSMDLLSGVPEKYLVSILGGLVVGLVGRSIMRMRLSKN